MPILMRFGALTALAALAACGTTKSTAAIDDDDLLSAASVYTPTYYDELEDFQNADFVFSDTPGDGLVGFMGFSDGNVRPVRVRISEDASSAFLSVSGGPEVEFDIENFEGSWDGSTGTLRVDVEGYYENYVQFEGSDDSYAAGYFGQQTGPGDLLTDVVEFSGGGDFSGDGIGGGFGMFLTMNFSTNSISGSLEGGFGERDGPGGSFEGDITGEMAGSFFAMTSDVTGTGVTGNLGFLGAFYDFGEYFGGGVAGSLNGQTVGGSFVGSTFSEEF